VRLFLFLFFCFLFSFFFYFPKNSGTSCIEINRGIEMPNSPELQVDPENGLGREGYLEVLNKIVENGFCPFCEEHLFKHHPNPVIFQNKHWTVTTNAWPYVGTTHHFILICRTHIERAENTTGYIWKSLGDAYKYLCKKYTLTGATLLMRSGDTQITGASVRHLHAQVIVGGKREPDTLPITAVVGFQNKTPHPS
jgi:diadenosine tetraphosphate (Ap4A) HIT family hydrolase